MKTHAQFITMPSRLTNAPKDEVITVDRRRDVRGRLARATGPLIELAVSGQPVSRRRAT